MKRSVIKAIALSLVLILAVCALTACGKPAKYEVLVRNEAGKPVSGVMVQFCSDTECMMGTTDENGIAAFEQDAGSYTVHVLKVPEGFENVSEEFAAPAQPGRLVIVLK